MSDIEREEFEQAVTDRWSDSYSFTRFGDEDYYDEVLEGMWWGWQASRQVDGESVAYITERKLEWLKSGLVLSAVVYRKHSEGSIPLYTHPASSDEWIKCSERLPKESDGDCHGIVWVYNKGLSWVEISDLEDVKFISDYTHWMPTNLVRPEPPKQEEGQ